jgi:hypothetical protein
MSRGDSTELAEVLPRRNESVGGSKGGMTPWSQGTGSTPAREGEAGSLDGIEATVGRGKAKLFPLRVD